MHATCTQHEQRGDDGNKDDVVKDDVAKDNVVKDAVVRAYLGC